MKRRPEWRQNTPRDELVGVISAAQGHLLNVISGDAPERRLIQVRKFLEDAQLILRHFEMESAWDYTRKRK